MRRHLLFGSSNAPEIVKMANFRIWKQDMVLLIQHTRAYTTSITLTVCRSLVLHSMLQISSSVYQNRQHRTEISTLDGMGNGLSEVLNTVNYTDIHRHIYIYIYPHLIAYIFSKFAAYNTNRFSRNRKTLFTSALYSIRFIFATWTEHRVEKSLAQINSDHLLIRWQKRIRTMLNLKKGKETINNSIC